MAETFHRAVTMPKDERRTRMRALRRRVMRFDVRRWADAFLDALAAGGEDGRGRDAVTEPQALDALVARMAAAAPLILLLDYDGCLVPFAPIPELAKPDGEVLALLRALAARPMTQVHVVSGRAREDLETWLGDLPLALHAEHGLWSRMPGEPGRETPIDASWKERVRPILLDYADRTPGTLVEEKAAGLAWHFRMADAHYGRSQANELRKHLTELLGNTPVEIVPGDRVIELRPHGVNKGRIVARLLERAAPGLIVAFGDDVTDEDMFAALPPSGISIRIGNGDSRAGFRVAMVDDVRALLSRLVAQPSV
jgi:trehalose 6-phosphate synthase/phosphatase